MCPRCVSDFARRRRTPSVGAAVATIGVLRQGCVSEIDNVDVNVNSALTGRQPVCGIARDRLWGVRQVLRTADVKTQLSNLLALPLGGEIDVGTQNGHLRGGEQWSRPQRVAQRVLSPLEVECMRQGSQGRCKSG